MSDRDLLEAAARAAGIYYWIDGNAICTHGDAPGSSREWNPLEDDGDEARLEAALDLDVAWLDDCVIVYPFTPCVEARELFSDHGGDKQAARRRAGVRAAAALTQPEGGA